MDAHKDAVLKTPQGEPYVGELHLAVHAGAQVRGA